MCSAGCVAVSRKINHIGITVQHGSAHTVVRVMNVKYRKWRLGGSGNSETP